jgi:primosomal protein N' (replication factor Y) (superfamily II helicase)
MKILRVGLDLPVDTLFDYRADDASAADIGRRVVVPIGRRTAVGVALELADSSAVPAARLKPVVRVLRDEAGFSPADLRLLRFAAAYYHHPLGAVVMNALPQRLRRTKGAQAAAPGQFALTAAGARIVPDDLPVRAFVQRRLLALFKERGALDRAAVRASAATAPAALRQFLERGWVAPCTPASPVPAPAVAGPPLTPEQAAAVEALTSALGVFQPFLLRGITGSGKTEVYLHAMAAVLAAGRQALVLVPEIALTPQLEMVVRDRFPGAHLVTLHSGLNESERVEHWAAAHAGAAGIVLGTRLAVFVPLPKLGLIVVDEEHDASFKQMEGLRYSARDLAIVRAQNCGVPVLLGSATPALESHYNAMLGRYQLLELTRRIQAAPPLIDCIDTKEERLADGLSQRLLDAIAIRLARGEQSLIFINRRGYAPVLTCRACGWLSGCQRCSAKLVLHLNDRQLRCHHCGHVEPVPVCCANCSNPDLVPLGQGTQRVEAALRSRFPQARIARIDRDSTRRRFAWHGMRERIRAREIDILVGTQILAKGHDFPHLNLVAALNADASLYSTDFRAAERLFALLTQVAGRAGRGATRGEVLVQTDFPQHPLYAALRDLDYSALADTLLAERRAAGFPPFVHQALLRAEAARLDAAIEFLARAAEIGRVLALDVTIYDPVPAGMVRRAGRERAQLLVQSENRAVLQQFLSQWYARLASDANRRARWSLDVDPIEL